MTLPHVLISLHKGYGLGDAVHMSSVLRHVARARPYWLVDYCAEEGKHQVGRGIVANTFAYGQPHPSEHYDSEVQMVLYDTWRGWTDRPNTNVSSCLHDCFQLPWTPESQRYEVEISRKSMDSAGRLLGNTKCVAVHYEGDSSPAKKNLTQDQALEVCRAIEALGRIPLVLDWRYKSLLPCAHGIRKLRAPSAWGGNAEMVCAVISQCEAFVGVDSGPAKCASATDTPTLVVWTGHHPAQFHDPAPNTTHLVPRGYHQLGPVCDNEAVVKWFERHYTTRQYVLDPVMEIKTWLSEVLK